MSTRWPSSSSDDGADAFVKSWNDLLAVHRDKSAALKKAS